MLTAAIVRIVDFCVRHARIVVAVLLMVAAGAGIYTVRHFKITSDVNALLSDQLPWRKREAAFEKSFHHFQMIIAVVEAPTPELTSQATEALTRRLAADKSHFIDATDIAGLPFFAREGLLFLPLDELRRNLGGLVQGAPLFQDFASDMSLRGLVAGLEDSLIGVNSGKLRLDAMAPTLDAASSTVDAALAGRPASFSWRVLTEGRPATPSELRGVIEVRPVLDYRAVEPGEGASNALRAIAAEVAPRYQARVRLTGPVALSDEEFSTIKHHATRDELITGGIVLFILWRALRSWRLIAAVCVNLIAGLAVTAALGLALVGDFNLISVYFAVLFVGIGVDFGLQLSVRYRAERHDFDNLAEAISRAGFHFGAPLTLAGLATAAGFLSFLPTNYKGLSELGLIAGMGMLVAYASSVTLLPALISLFNPPGEPEPLGYARLAPVDRYLARHRKGIIAGTALVVIGGMPLLHWLKFDFNPVNLYDPHAEAMATYLQLERDPSAGVNAIQLLAPSQEQANEDAKKLSALPEVSGVRTLSSFIPGQQAEKLASIAEAAKKLEPALTQTVSPKPSDSETIEALNEAAGRLNDAAEDSHNSGQAKGIASAKRLAQALGALARAEPAVREKVQEAMIGPLAFDIGGLREELKAENVTQASLPPELTREWIAPDGQARVSIDPKSEGSNKSLSAFGRAVLKVEPNATEGPISTLEAGNTIVGAFIEAAGLAILSIAILLWLVLQRLSDVLLTLIPLMLAAVVTLEITVLIGMPLNYANIIALPLLLGVGVAFKIYYIMAWRQGQTDLLQTSLTRAVMFSAATTATAFGSLWFSSNPGTSSMGKLLALSLGCTMLAAVLFQPILMGKPREGAGKTQD